jgi:hypothetical protein
MCGPKGLLMISQDEKLMIFAFPKLMGVIVAPVKRFAWNHRPLTSSASWNCGSEHFYLLRGVFARANPVQEPNQPAHAG